METPTENGHIFTGKPFVVDMSMKPTPCDWADARREALASVPRRSDTPVAPRIAIDVCYCRILLRPQGCDCLFCFLFFVFFQVVKKQIFRLFGGRIMMTSIVELVEAK